MILEQAIQYSSLVLNMKYLIFLILVLIQILLKLNNVLRKLFIYKNKYEIIYLKIVIIY